MKSIYRWMMLRPLDATSLLAANPDAALNARAIRVATLLLVIAILNGVDLAYTLFAHRIGWLDEMNPLASFLLALGREPSLICFKISLLAIASVTLWRLRRSGWTVPACWVLVAAYSLLTLVWYLWAREVISVSHIQIAMRR